MTPARSCARSWHVEGVDVSALSVVPDATTAQSAILVGPTGARSIVHHPGTATLTRADLPADAAWVHVDHVGYVLSHTHRPARVSVDGGNAIGGLDLRSSRSLCADGRHAAGGVRRRAGGARLPVLTSSSSRGAPTAASRRPAMVSSPPPASPAPTSSARSGPATSSTARCSRSSTLGETLRSRVARANTCSFTFVPGARRSLGDPDPDELEVEPRSVTQPWWRDAVFYEIYVRSFADSNGDGVGDLPGIRHACRTCASSASTRSG